MSLVTTDSQRQQATASSIAILSNKFKPDEVLLGYQKRWIEDDSQLKIVEKSRRTGLTWAEAADNALTAAKATDAGGEDVFYIGSTKDMAREYIEAVAMWSKAFSCACGDTEEEVFEDEDKDITVFVVRYASGNKVKALSSNPANMRGMQGTIVIDEAGHNERLAESIKAANALTMWGSKVRVISTHNGARHLFNQLIQDSRAGTQDYSVHTIPLDEACADGLYKRICQVKKKEWSQEAQDEWIAKLLRNCASKDDALEEYFCIPKASSGQHIPLVLIDAAMKDGAKRLEIESPDGFMEWPESARDMFVQQWCEKELKPELDKLNVQHHHTFGEDFARKGDLSIFVPLAERNDLSKYVPFYVELRNMTYDAQREVMFAMCNRLPRRRGMAFDATGNGGYLAEAAALKYGTKLVEQVMLNEAWYREWMPKLKAQFESQNIDLPRNEDVKSDLCEIQVINGVPKIDKGKTKGEDGKQRHGDFAVALAMAERASWMDGSAIEFEAMPTANSNNSESDDNFFNNTDDIDDAYHQFEQGAW